MRKKMTQDQQLAELVEIFKNDSGVYRDIETPKDRAGKRRLLRSLMNIRMPGNMPQTVMELQNEYLRARAQE